VPTVHSYSDHYFVTVHSPLLGKAGHVHLLELDQIIGHHFLVTVHGPINPDLDISVALVETDAVLGRLEGGRFHPKTPAELSYAVTSAVARRQRAAIGEVSMKLPGLEKEVMSSKLTDPELLLETMFLIRHELITTRTMAAQCHDVWRRLVGINRLVDDVDAAYARDVADQFDRIRSLADGESQFLFGVIELYQTKVHTKMTVAMERLAVIAAVTLPVTALASVYGMNVIVNESTHWTQLIIVLLVMLTISTLLLAWARRQGWW
jgi:Mg2+ and Co2+ transporter CorA